MSVISSLQTSSSVRRPDVCRPGMDENPRTVVFKAEPSITMQHRDLYGSRTRFLSVPTKLSWERHVSSNGFMTNASVKSNIIMVTMVSSLRRSLGATVRKNDKVSRSPESVPNTKMHALSVLYRPSCIWHALSWFMPHFIGQKEVLTISLSGPLQSNIQSGFTIMYRMLGRASLRGNWLPGAL